MFQILMLSYTLSAFAMSCSHKKFSNVASRCDGLVITLLLLWCLKAAALCDFESQHGVWQLHHAGHSIYVTNDWFQSTWTLNLLYWPKEKHSLMLQWQGKVKLQNVSQLVKIHPNRRLQRLLYNTKIQRLVPENQKLLAALHWHSYNHCICM